MPFFDPTLLRQEVNELTTLLRDDEKWSDLRKALESRGLSADRVVLAGFMEDSESNEFGVVITDRLQVFEFQRKMSGRSARFIKWRTVANVNEVLKTFPAVECGLEIVRDLQEP